MNALAARELPGRGTIGSRIGSFLRWLDGYGCDSYDPYDLWSTAAGRLARKTYYAHKLLGAPMVAPIMAADALVPGIRRWVSPKRRYPIADAHVILGSLEWERQTGGKEERNRAVRMGGELLAQSIPGFSGHCWGFPFEWESSRGLIRKGTPLITTTPYCFEAFLALGDATGEPAYYDVARSAAEFASRDLNETALEGDAAACSYTPLDRSRVVNASGYRAMMLLEASARFNRPAMREQAVRNIAFVLQSQREDGSWLYEPESANNAFVDNMHTCFTLKNLLKANRHLQDDRVEQAIRKGYEYYLRHLLSGDGSPKPFAEVRRFQPVRLDGYDVAEGIVLGVLMGDRYPGALDVARRLFAVADERLWLDEGYFAAKIPFMGPRIRIPYLRWPLAQMFHAMTLLHGSLSE